jgi:titin
MMFERLNVILEDQAMLSRLSLPRAGRRLHRRFPLQTLEALEGRALLTSFVVSNPNDSGPGSLRQAILDADRHPGNDRIRFAIPGDGARVIFLVSSLPAVTDPVIIDGFTEPGSRPNSSAEGDEAVRLIVLEGFAAGAANGLVLTGGGITVRGLVIDGFSGSGIAIASRGGDTIAGNAIGTDATGTRALGNGQDGVAVLAPGNIIGGTTSAARNLISGNGLDGVIVAGGSSSNLIAGNYIGTNAAGTAALGNAAGVLIANSPSNVIGGSVTAARNLISGNHKPGVLILGQDATKNAVSGNYIGTNVDGTSALPNAIGFDILNAPGNTIGGLVASEGNLIAAALGDQGDILGGGSTDNLVAANKVGTTASGLGRIGGSENGICIINAPNNQLGGTTAGSQNVISGFARNGVVITGPAATGNRVEGNLIGTDVTGTNPLGSGSNGVKVTNGASGNTIGGTEPGAANVIAFNGTSGTGSGVAVSSGVRNTILSNRIYGNAGAAITVDPQKGTAGNDAPGTPVVRSATLTTGRLLIDGSLTATPGSRVLVQFFLSDPSRPWIGSSFLGSETVTTSAAGLTSFKAAFSASASVGEQVNATATVLGGGTSPYSTGVLFIRL